MTRLFTDLPLLLLATWTLLALVWLVATPKPAPDRAVPWRDRVYPLLPVAVGVAALAWLRWPAAAVASGERGSLAPWLAAWLHAGVWFWAVLTAVWVLSVLKKDSSIMDIAYGYVLLVLPWWLTDTLGRELTGSTALLLVCTTLGFGRYALYITWRNLPHGEDARYARWRQRGGARWWWWSYFQVFLLQGVVIWIWCLPMALVLAAPQPPGVWHAVGALVWAVGLVFEAGGDWQLTRFKRRRTDAAQLLDTGLWSLTRHPNYFGQTCMWWGYAVMALAHPAGWLALPCAAYVTWFMYKGSATSLMERHMARSKPGYAAYCERVPAFFPRWPARASRTGQGA
jgi:steroid 5-alpha reductase family enzyme